MVPVLHVPAEHAFAVSVLITSSSEEEQQYRLRVPSASKHPALERVNKQLSRMKVANRREKFIASRRTAEISAQNGAPTW